MAKLQVVFVDFNEQYLLTLEKRILEELGDIADIELISEKEYFDQYFSTPRKLDLLIINQDLYTQELDRHNVGHVFLMTEEETEQANLPGKFTAIYKYTSIKEIFSKITGRAGNIIPMSEEEKRSKLILFYSPAGGCGQTSVALGFCSALANNYKRVLYISMDSLQAEVNGLEGGEKVKAGAERPIASESEYAYEATKPFIKMDYFSWLPPFSGALSSLGISTKSMIPFITQAVESKDFDYVVVDAPAEFTESTTSLMANSVQTVMVVQQNKSVALKLKALMENIDCSDNRKFFFVCNQYLAAEKNYLLDNEFPSQSLLFQYVDKLPAEITNDLEALGKNENLQKLALSAL